MSNKMDIEEHILKEMQFDIFRLLEKYHPCLGTASTFSFLIHIGLGVLIYDERAENEDNIKQYCLDSIDKIIKEYKTLKENQGDK